MSTLSGDVVGLYSAWLWSYDAFQSPSCATAHHIFQSEMQESIIDFSLQFLSIRHLFLGQNAPFNENVCEHETWDSMRLIWTRFGSFHHSFHPVLLCVCVFVCSGDWSFISIRCSFFSARIIVFVHYEVCPAKNSIVGKCCILAAANRFLIISRDQFVSAIELSRQ